MKKQIIALGFSCLLTQISHAATLQPQEMARMQTLSAQLNVPMSEINEAVSQADFRQEVLDAYKRPAESKPWYQYEALFLTEKRIQDGATFWKEHAATLARAERTYQVPASVIVAILGVETFYGNKMGQHPILDSLYTLSFNHPTRTDFFSKEFVNYIKLGYQQGWDLKMKQGSYAGAMGMGQFMPSSYLAYAVDFDGDGHIDLFNSADDAIGSVANYFHIHGWKMGEPVAEKAALATPQASALVEAKVTQKKTWAQLQAAGVRVAQPLPAATPVTLLAYEQASYVDYWVARHNLYVITRYNQSPLYAMAVNDLSKAISKQYDGQ